jgi:hypothetical protein
MSSPFHRGSRVRMRSTGPPLSAERVALRPQRDTKQQPRTKVTGAAGRSRSLISGVSSPPPRVFGAGSDEQLEGCLPYPWVYGCYGSDTVRPERHRDIVVLVDGQAGATDHVTG